MQVLFLLILSSKIIFLVRATTYAPQSSIIDPMDEDKDSEKEGDFNDAELGRIVVEIPLDDPMNAFYDPQEPYRLSNYAYWRPITYPEVHENPPLPTGFIPPNAPPRSLPSDFFNDDEARKLVLSEHGASFCPYLRRWREKHPLKPYQLGPDFMQRHPPIKFISGKGYEIDFELDHIKKLSQTIEEEVLDDYATKLYYGEISPNPLPIPSEKNALNVPNVPNMPPTDAATNTVPGSGPDLSSAGQTALNEIPPEISEERKPMRKNPYGELGFLLKIVGEVQNVRMDCRNMTDFTKPIVAENVYYSYPPSCLLEVVLRMEEIEDIHDASDDERDSPEIADKPEYFRQILLRVGDEKDFDLKKCPFGFGNSKSKKKKKESEKSAISKPQNPHKQIKSSNFPKIYKGKIPEWAKLNPGERIFSTEEEDSDGAYAEKYLFPYTPVPLPSIQKTLKKYVGL